MDFADALSIFRAQTSNTRALRATMGHVRRSINFALRTNDEATAVSFTKLHALTFCAWAEANFSKVIHTPHGFSLNEIEQIKNARADRGIGEAWKKAVSLGVRHLDARRGAFTPNTTQRLERAIDAYVIDPSQLRNKLAHGQWLIALNRDNDAIQQDLTNKIADMDTVKIGGWATVHAVLAEAVETLIESPKKAFMRNWWNFVVALEDEMKSAVANTLDEHIKRLRDKDARTNAHGKRNGRRE